MDSRTGRIEGSLVECSEELIDRVLTAATEVHTELGPGLLESVYECGVAIVLLDWKIAVERQVPIKARYKGKELGLGFRADLVVENQLLIEVKCVDQIAPIHIAQMITYLRLMGFKRGYILNFNKRWLKEGIKRVSI